MEPEQNKNNRNKSSFTVSRKRDREHFEKPTDLW